MKKIEDYWKSDLPEGERGSARIEKFSVSKSESDLTSIRGEYVPQGDYTRLMVNGGIMMSDTPQEMRDHAHLFHAARGDVLINGLGMGCCVNVLLNKPEVDTITVIEKSGDVIDLVAQHFLDKSCFADRLEIINADAFDYKPPKGVRYKAVWHDIWPDICEDNLPEMHKLHRKYGRRTDWQGSWSRERTEYIKRKNSRGSLGFVFY